MQPPCQPRLKVWPTKNCKSLKLSFSKFCQRNINFVSNENNYLLILWVGTDLSKF